MELIHYESRSELRAVDFGSVSSEQEEWNESISPAYAQTSKRMEAHFPSGSGTTFKASKVASAASCLPVKTIRRVSDKSQNSFIKRCFHTSRD